MSNPSLKGLSPRVPASCGVRRSIVKYIVILSFVFLLSCSTIQRDEKEVSDTWETGIPNSCRSWSGQRKIDDKSVFEVSKSSFDFASFYLSSSEIVSLKGNEVKEYLGFVPVVEGDVQPYLVRALYGHSGTGAFNFSWCGDAVAIYHGSLGRFNIINRTAFVLYLPKSPSRVYLEVSIDE